MIPKIGMTFISEDEVRNFYKSYAQNVGFGICKLGGKKGDDGKQKYFCFGCAKSGKTISQAKNALYPRPSTKTNCKAKINVVIRNDDNFVISSVSLEHNHVLSPGKSRHFRFEARGYENLTFDERKCRNYISEARRLRLGDGDAEALNARCRAAYDYFSDVVTFDTTYLTNSYDMPFAPFVGAIITDQCRAMTIAIEEMFPDSHHRLCLWHIMKKLPAKLSGHAQYKLIKKQLKNIVYNSLTIDECDKNWMKMIEDFNLENNDWLKSLYEQRNRWIPVYVKDKFWAGGLGAGMIALKDPGILYWGFTNVEEILHTGKSASAPGIWLLTQLVCAKVVATAICKGSGLVGGLYAPSLMIGAALGAVFGGSAAELINSTIPGNGAVAQPQAYALVGMAATLASVCSVPLTSVLLLFELTKDYRILLPLMVTNGFVLTKILAMGYCDLELSQLETDIHRSGTINNEMLLDDLKVSLAMSKTQRQCNEDAIVLMHDKQQTCVLIIDHEDFLEGILTLGDIRRKGFETSGELPGTPRLVRGLRRQCAKPKLWKSRREVKKFKPDQDHSNELCKFVKLNEAMTFLDREDVVQVEPYNALLKDLCNASRYQEAAIYHYKMIKPLQNGGGLGEESLAAGRSMGKESGEQRASRVFGRRTFDGKGDRRAESVESHWSSDVRWEGRAASRERRESLVVGRSMGRESGEQRTSRVRTTESREQRAQRAEGAESIAESSIGAESGEKERRQGDDEKERVLGQGGRIATRNERESSDAE
ncbi:hypothetical protein ZIOFF_039142 [Zingiber officinale]|uniref:Chloride channel protein n=1 Tax=Zingiber officinale TaxID=94328 RepID=A0A8J5L2U1_ZINOF|nr:hypothetical protein ZIOFF_039142 [Zingiber officinale]